MERSSVLSNYITHAIREFKAAGWMDPLGNYEDEMQALICKHVLKLLDVFNDEGHSGSSAPYAINLFKALAMFEPLCPLTGNDDEWNEVGNGVFQNNRCSHVFRNKERFNGQAYDIDAVIFREPNGSCYTNSESSQPVVFPYTPERKYVDVPG
jgi:hypothetical protein